VTSGLSAGTAARLVMRVRVRRMVNRLAASRRKPGPPTRSAGVGWKRGDAQQRRGTAGKGEAGLGLGIVMGVLFAFSATTMAWRALDNVIHNYAGRSWTPAVALPLPALSYLIVEVALILLAALTLALANKDISSTEWDLEWLVTLPAPTRTLLAVRILERTLINPFGIIALWPFLAVVAHRHGAGWSAPLLGGLLAIPLLALTAALQTVVDTGLRLRLAPSRLRNLQALFTILGTVAMYLCVAPTMGRGLPFEWPAGLPAWALLTPPGLAVQLLTGRAPGWAIPLLVVQVLGVLAGTVAWLEHELRAGVVGGGTREGSARKHGRPTPAPTVAPVAAGGPGPREWLSPVQRRELKLLARDRNFLVQTTVTPLLVVGFQLALTLGGPGGLSLAAVDLTHLAALGFGIAAYTLMFSAFQTLNNEGGALWLLYTLPRSLGRILLDKALLWGGLALIYPLALFVAAALTRPSLPPQAFLLLAIALVGVPIYALIATSLGVFGANPLAQEVQRKIRPSHAYLYLLLSSLYTYAIYATSLWQRGGLLVLTLLLGLALWQKARDRLPYLLDPTAAPPSRVSLADGMLAALLFFVLQALVGVLLARKTGKLTGTQLALAFVIAGAVASIGTRVAHAFLGATGIPRVLGPRAGRALVWGLVGGVLAAALGGAYLAVLLRFPALRPALEQSQMHLPAPGLWLVGLAVLAAPVFEEAIFRGLVFGGLRRSVGFPAAALASAAIFAVVHPPIAVIPVFGLALVAAYVYERTHLLLAPMVTHAVYNAVVVALSLR
jgi:ABC-2 type transport system permease protein